MAEILLFLCLKDFIPTCHIMRQKFCGSKFHLRYNDANKYSSRACSLSAMEETHRKLGCAGPVGAK